MAIALEKRYAQAFLNVFASVVTPQMLESATALCTYLKEHRRIVFMLKLSVLDTRIKIQGLHELCEKFGLGKPFQRLIALLQEDHRLPLLPDVLCHLEEIYREREKIYAFMVDSSIELAQEKRKSLEKSLAEQLAGTMLCTYRIDPRLIAGIRAQSTTYLWEDSIAKQLRTMQLALSR